MSNGQGQDLAGKEKEMRSILPRLASQIINESKSVTEEEMKEIDEGDRSDAPSDADAPSGAENGQPQQMENGSSTATENEQANQEEREQNGTEEKGSEWEWLSVLLGETYTSILGVSDKIINSSNFIKSDVSINITPLSAPTGVSAVSPLSGKLPHSSRTPTPSTPGTRPSGLLSPPPQGGAKRLRGAHTCCIPSDQQRSSRAGSNALRPYGRSCWLPLRFVRSCQMLKSSRRCPALIHSSLLWRGAIV